MLEALEAAGAYRATSFDAPRSNEDDAGDSLADAFGDEESGFGLAEDRATLERLMAAITPARARGAAPALRRGPDAGRDRRAHRRLADAGLAPHPPVARPPAHRRRSPPSARRCGEPSRVVRAMPAILDIDGTLVDTNYQHALAWYRAFRQQRRHPPDLADPPRDRDGRRPARRAPDRRGAGDEELGDDIRAAEKALYLSMIEEVEPFEGARDLIVDLKERGPHGRPRQLARRPTRSSTTSTCSTPATSSTTGRRPPTSRRPSPQPDLVQAALEKAGTDDGGDGRRHAVGHRGGQEGRRRRRSP